MKLAGAALAALCLALPATAQETEDEMQRKTRELGLSVGNAYVCIDEGERAAFETDWKMMYDMIVMDAGSDLAFVFATSSGYGASLPKAELDCTALAEGWEQTRADFGLAEGEDE
jgi:hypothetical protein